MLRCLVKNGGDEYKKLFVGLRTDELGLDTGKEVEGVGLGRIEIEGPVKSSSWKRDLTDFAKRGRFPLVILRNWKRLHSLAVAF